jgi:hypothetical protein
MLHSRSRPFSLRAIIAPAALAIVCGCSRERNLTPEQKAHIEYAEQFEPIQGRPLEPLESVTYEIPPDGRWHSSPYIALRNHLLQVEPIGSAAGLPELSIEFRIGSPRSPGARRLLHVSDLATFNVTEAGPLAFRFNRARVDPGFGGRVQVNITRLDRPR